MTIKFIKVSIIHSTDVMQDTESYIRVDTIVAIQLPTPVDNKQRTEVNTLLHTHMGTYAVGEKAETILEKLTGIEV